MFFAVKTKKLHHGFTFDIKKTEGKGKRGPNFNAVS